MILIPLLLPSDSPKKVINDDGWEVVTSNNNQIKDLISGEDIDCHCESYDSEEYNNEYFYATDSSHNKYWFLVPTQSILTRGSYYLTKYIGSVDVYYGEESFDSIDKYVNEYIEDYRNNYSQFYIKRHSIDNNSFVIITKAINSSDNKYFEELVIYSHNEDNYSFVKYLTLNQKFTDNFINKVIDGFKKEEHGANYSSCKVEGNQYLCSIDINNYNKKIEFSIDKTKYVMEDVARFDEYMHTFENASEDDLESYISINILLGDNILESIKNDEWIAKYKYEEKLFNGKKVDKYLNDTNDQIEAYYVISLDDNIAVVLTLEHKQEFMDDVASTLINFELKDL